MAVDDDAATRFLAEPPRRELLQPDIDRELDRGARAVGLGFEFLDQLAAGGDFNPLPAGLAAQPVLERLFQPVLADLEARGDQERIGLLLAAPRRRLSLRHDRLFPRASGRNFR